MKIILGFFLFFSLAHAYAKNLDRYDEVKVYKSKHRMELYFQGNLVKTYKIMLGKGGLNSKTKEGDMLVPEGRYILDEKNPYSKYFRSIHISYPNQQDIERAKKAGVDPGKDIFLHGMPNDFEKYSDWLKKHKLEKLGESILRKIFTLFDWTAGCIAVTDRNMEEIFDHFEGPTPITIYH